MIFMPWEKTVERRKYRCMFCGGTDHMERDCHQHVFRPELDGKWREKMKSVWRFADLETTRKDLLPDDGVHVLIVVEWKNGDREIEVGYLDKPNGTTKRRWYIRRLGEVFGFSGKVMLWSPLPELPKGTLHRCPNCDFEYIDDQSDD